MGWDHDPLCRNTAQLSKKRADKEVCELFLTNQVMTSDKTQC